jgi:hypothetical protein
MATCTMPEAHEAHMRMNGECPWCGGDDPSAIDPNMTICEPHGNPDCGICDPPGNWAEDGDERDMDW